MDEHMEYKPDISGKQFLSTGEPSVKGLQNTEEKTHKCNICGKYMVHPANLKNHYLIHTGEKPYKL